VRHKLGRELFHQPKRFDSQSKSSWDCEKHPTACPKLPKFLQREECFCIDVERRTGAQERVPPMCNLRFPKKRPMNALKIAVAMIG